MVVGNGLIAKAFRGFDSVPNEDFLTHLQSISYTLPDDYLQQIIKKYYR